MPDVEPDPESRNPLPIKNRNLFESGLILVTPMPLLPMAPIVPVIRQRLSESGFVRMIEWRAARIAIWRSNHIPAQWDPCPSTSVYQVPLL